MTAICLIDTTILVELIDVPDKASDHDATVDRLADKIRAGESLFLPMAVVFETGNHIGQIRDGRLRRRCAEQFVKQVKGALDGRIPFRPVRFPGQDDVTAWIDEFPDSATRGMGLGDLSIVKDWERLRTLSSTKRVYIWTLDEHLSGYDHEPGTR